MISLADKAHLVALSTAMVANDGNNDKILLQNGNYTGVDIDEKVAFAASCLRNYLKQDWIGPSIPGYFVENFAALTIKRDLV